MSRFDRTLIDPTEDLLHRTLAQAREVVRDRSRLGSFGAISAQIRSRPEGIRPLRLRGGHDDGHATIAVAWATAPLARRHHRAAAEPIGPLPHLLRSDRDRFPPPFHVHPDRLFLRTRDGRSEWLASCPCGVTGPPAAISWM